ncbi:MAG TPA: fluoride efflux transporter CrcB [Chitinophagaceae bacterium]|nr:fluoride efflux transporter CrcB [Chitinophagaceae bacterium]
MKIILAIGAGSFAGGILRYLLTQFIDTKTVSAFPFGTLTVNIIGCFLIGVIFTWITNTTITPDWGLFLTTGFLGGFTTFSAFSIESIGLMRNGNTGLAVTYILISVIAGLLACYTGFILFRKG